MSGAAGARRSLRTKLPDSNTNPEGQPPIGRAALLGLCPRCGAQTLFEGPVRFAPRCRACGLDFGAYNVGDGPAAFLTLIVGALLIVAALLVDFAFEPPLWVHVILWVPLTIAAVVLGLRLAKAALLASEHQRKAAEGRLAEEEEHD
jgi:Uncharacterized protein conserved in bacteria